MDGQHVAVSLPPFMAERAQGTVTLYRAADVRADRVIDLALDRVGRQVLSTADLPGGHWIVQLRWTADTRRVLLRAAGGVAVTSFAAGLLLGLAGSAHCASMCGPLLLAMSGGGDVHGSRLLRMVVYHGGRVLMYLAIGGAAGLVGHAVSSGGIGRGVSVIAGVVLVIVAAGSGARLIRHGLSRFWSMSLVRASRAACRSRQKHPIAGQLLAGAVNGLLPCGLVYAAAVAAAGLGGVWTGLVFMAGFGAGTIRPVDGDALRIVTAGQQSRASQPPGAVGAGGDRHAPDWTRRAAGAPRWQRARAVQQPRPLTVAYFFGTSTQSHPRRSPSLKPVARSCGYRFFSSARTPGINCSSRPWQGEQTARCATGRITPTGCRGPPRTRPSRWLDDQRTGRPLALPTAAARLLATVSVRMFSTRDTFLPSDPVRDRVGRHVTDAHCSSRPPSASSRLNSDSTAF